MEHRCNKTDQAQKGWQRDNIERAYFVHLRRQFLCRTAEKLRKVLFHLFEDFFVDIAFCVSFFQDIERRFSQGGFPLAITVGQPPNGQHHASDDQYPEKTR